MRPVIKENMNIKDYSLDFIREHKDEIDWGFFQYKFFKNEKQLEEFKDKLDWILIVRQKIHLSETFIDKYKEKWEWYELLKYYKFSEKFLFEHIDYLNWEAVSTYQQLSEDFMVLFQNKLDWHYLSGTQKFSPEFMIEFIDKIDWQSFEEYNKDQPIPWSVYKKVAKKGLWDPYNRQDFKFIYNM